MFEIADSFTFGINIPIGNLRHHDIAAPSVCSRFENIKGPCNVIFDF